MPRRRAGTWRKHQVASELRTASAVRSQASTSNYIYSQDTFPPWRRLKAVIIERHWLDQQYCLGSEPPYLSWDNKPCSCKVQGDIGADSTGVLLLASKLRTVVLPIPFWVATAKQNKAEVLLLLQSLPLLCIPCLAALSEARAKLARDLRFTAYKRPIACNGGYLESNR